MQSWAGLSFQVRAMTEVGGESRGVGFWKTTRLACEDQMVGLEGVPPEL